jgi:hypothetical protein
LEPVRDWRGGIDLDPCTTPDNPTEAREFYAPPQDGAVMPWTLGSVFVNPPYGKARERWVRRCVQAAQNGSTVVLLIPAHTDTSIFHLALETATWVVFIKGRVKFGVLRPNRRQAAASHPSALIGWGDEVSPMLSALGTPMEYVRQVNRDAALRSPDTVTAEPVLDHAPGCDVFRIAESWEPYGEPRHCDCGFSLWDAKRRGVYNWTPPDTETAGEAG